MPGDFDIPDGHDSGGGDLGGLGCVWNFVLFSAFVVAVIALVNWLT